MKQAMNTSGKWLWIPSGDEGSIQAWIVIKSRTVGTSVIIVVGSISVICVINSAMNKKIFQRVWEAI